tara:strand:- start:1215 stop:1748 length:534 start_codon:yes stop_codon:yes gene_type:complete
MPKTKGAIHWKVHEVEKVMRVTRNKKKLSASDPDFTKLCSELGRSEGSVRHIISQVRRGTNALLRTEEGRKKLNKYVEGKTSKRTLKDRVKDAVKTFKTNESTISLSMHKQLMDKRTQSLNNKTKEMVVLAHAWGYNQGVADYRGKFLDSVSELNKRIPGVNNEVVTQTSKILFNNG